MDELLSKAMQGVDLDAPGAFWHVFVNLLALVPWGQLMLWNVVFVLVGAALGWWRGRTRAGVLWALVLGPIGWIIVLWPERPRQPGPPPLPGRRR
jgi:hypothetical protein